MQVSKNSGAPKCGHLEIRSICFIPMQPTIAPLISGYLSNQGTLSRSLHCILIAVSGFSKLHKLPTAITFILTASRM